MNKTAQTELHRLFLIEGLPDPLTPASSHLQIFDNYIENTRMRLRQIRDPYSKAWTRILQQRFPAIESEAGGTKLAEIHLNDDEYAVFERFAGREIRKNRYFHEFDRVSFAFDVYLGDLWGLNTARVEFDTLESMEAFISPPFARFEVTADTFFAGENLVGKKFGEVQAEVAKIGAQLPPASDLPDE
jgi:CYTH domain-containing protein